MNKISESKGKAALRVYSSKSGSKLLLHSASPIAPAKSDNQHAITGIGRTSEESKTIVLHEKFGLVGKALAIESLPLTHTLSKNVQRESATTTPSVSPVSSTSVSPASLATATTETETQTTAATVSEPAPAPTPTPTPVLTTSAPTTTLAPAPVSPVSPTTTSKFISPPSRNALMPGFVLHEEITPINAPILEEDEN